MFTPFLIASNSRRRLPRPSASLLVVVAAAVLSAATNAAAPTNILFFLPDDLGYQSPGATEQKTILAPRPFLCGESHPFRPGGTDGAQAVRFGAWKAVRSGVHRPGATPTLELFDLRSDPSETTSVAARFPELVPQANGYLDSRQLAIILGWNDHRAEL